MFVPYPLSNCVGHLPFASLSFSILLYFLEDWLVKILSLDFLVLWLPGGLEKWRALVGDQKEEREIGVFIPLASILQDVMGWLGSSRKVTTPVRKPSPWKPFSFLLLLFQAWGDNPPLISPNTLLSLSVAYHTFVNSPFFKLFSSYLVWTWLLVSCWDPDWYILLPFLKVYDK